MYHAIAKDSSKVFFTLYSMPNKNITSNFYLNLRYNKITEKRSPDEGKCHWHEFRYRWIREVRCLKSLATAIFLSRFNHKRK